MNNVFKNAYFGKLYKTIDGRKAIYGGKNEASLLHSLMFQLGDGDAFLALYNSNGTYVMSRDANHLDIVSEWQVEINEEELEEYAESDSKSYWSDDMETFDGNPLEKEIYYVCRRCYKAGLKTGYRKAIEKYKEP